MIDCLLDCFIGWLVGWLFGRVVGWLVGSFILFYTYFLTTLYQRLFRDRIWLFQITNSSDGKVIQMGHNLLFVFSLVLAETFVPTISYSSGYTL